jgi:hypothetical protein
MRFLQRNSVSRDESDLWTSDLKFGDDVAELIAPLKKMGFAVDDDLGCVHEVRVVTALEEPKTTTFVKSVHVNLQIGDILRAVHNAMISQMIESSNEISW